MAKETLRSVIADIDAGQKKSNPIWGLIAPVLRSRYFMIALGLHLIFLLIWGGHVLMEYMPVRGSFEGVEELLVMPPAQPPPPQPKTEQAETKEVKVAVAAEPKSQVRRLTVTTPSQFVRAETPKTAPKFSMGDIKIDTEVNRQLEAARVARLLEVRNFQKGWKVKYSGKRTQAEFTIFKAKYSDGDWNCNPTDMENLMLQIRRWSSNRIKADLDPRVLDVGTEELFTIKPPFVYLTGHKDFHLLDTEVRNLRSYLNLGGAVWADSALAGRRSRFDIAFRREMKRVMPDRDFEIIGDDHPMFDTFFQNIKRPIGMNFYDEPVEVINIANRLAVCYTLNGYGHYWEARLTDKGAIEYNRLNVGTDEKPRFAHVHGPHAPRGGGSWWRRTIYRNYDDEQVRNCYRFGINMVVHLLTRYQEDFQTLPLDMTIDAPKTSKLLSAQGEDDGEESDATKSTVAPRR
ncbi:MAG: DUF4159 domain-containing protein [Lentisphaerae bacterium]|nr:DUF4159 domain-containing protein [Lentisphaerota bacterium]